VGGRLMNLNLSKVKKWGLVIFLVAITLSLFSYFFSKQYYQSGYIVKLGIYDLGMTSDKEGVHREYQNILMELQKNQEHLNYVEQPRPHYSEVRMWFLKDEKINIADQMKTLLQDEIVAWEIRVDDELIGMMDHKESGEQILDRVKSRFSSEEGELLSFKEQVTLSEVESRPVQLDTPDDVEDKLTTLLVPAKTHIVKEGDTIWDIAIQYNLTMDELQIKNPTMGDKIIPGEIVQISPEVRKLNVLSETTIEEELAVPFEIELIASSSGIKAREGLEGVKRVSYLIEKENGIEVGRSMLEEEIIKQPISQVIIKEMKVQVASTKDMTITDKGFIWPADGGIITSSFGKRNGRLHKGIDIAGTSSLDIHAAAAGEVTFSGTKGDYGNLIIISHSNGLTTYYAHNKKNLVSVGDRVKTGESIAVMGRTGNATGVSIHFEVREKGKALNPIQYVSQ